MPFPSLSPALFDLSNFHQVDLIARNRVGIGTATPRADLDVLGTFMGFQILDRTNLAGGIGDILASQGEFGNYVWTDSLDLTGTATVTGDITGRANIVAEGNLSGVNVAASGDVTAGGSVAATGAVTSDSSLAAPAHRFPAAETFAYNLAGNALQVRDEGETYVRSTNGYIFVGAGTTTLSLFGPVHLPHGAVVTGASALYQDNTDSGDFTEFDGRLRRRAIASSSNENIAVLQDAAPQSAPPPNSKLEWHHPPSPETPRERGDAPCWSSHFSGFSWWVWQPSSPVRTASLQIVLTSLACIATASAQPPQLASSSLASGLPQANSERYTLDSAIDTTGGPLAASSHYTLKPGYVGQLYNVAMVAVDAQADQVVELETNPLQASVTMDDGTTYAPEGTDVFWSVVSGPVSAILATGVAQTSPVFTDTPATGGACTGRSPAKPPSPSSRPSRTT